MVAREEKASGEFVAAAPLQRTFLRSGGSIIAAMTAARSYRSAPRKVFRWTSFRRWRVETASVHLRAYFLAQVGCVVNPNSLVVDAN